MVRYIDTLLTFHMNAVKFFASILNTNTETSFNPPPLLSGNGFATSIALYKKYPSSCSIGDILGSEGELSGEGPSTKKKLSDYTVIMILYNFLYSLVLCSSFEYIEQP